MRRLKVFWDFEAEEKYLNEMALQGYFLRTYSMLGVYHFDKKEPQQMNYKIDYQFFKTRNDFINYITLFEDAGWEHVYGSRFSGNQYFVPRKEEAGTEIFSDKISAAVRYKNLYYLCMVSVICLIIYLLMTLIPIRGDLSKIAFLIPGLWERTGKAFWSAFFFELPFALFRVVPVILFAVLAVFYGYWGMKAKESYQLRIKEGE